MKWADNWDWLESWCMSRLARPARVPNQDKHAKMMFETSSKSKKSWNGRNMTWQCIPKLWCDRRKRSIELVWVKKVLRKGKHIDTDEEDRSDRTGLLGHNACKGILNKLEGDQVGNRCCSEERITIIKPWSNYSRRHCLFCLSGGRWSNVAQSTDVEIWRFTCFRYLFVER